ncbi:spore protein [Aneurinibacillus migulanus]|jgi:hypothetical protein|uniref:Spore protein n=1 Tax=Aneurinibacillus migulanus TaxID=47500 RepID=A0A0D1WHZ7_ANEMI|nr:alpha/beta-type small acid-soluble spore protein [Aneurinibacillus migulanus]KIV56318.1 spore protein [Aneurinibacillus migulanus]KIV58130.1 spore protein [Aneurinibacillus migulanus]KON96996.1 spore protein [Aneurinibacillus migulanus]KPD06974.1 spore protein [Aneurinibacillus migulanus]MED0896188.1 alpha/beta-type small acid-soluble spore protein [Aneurinibacillus migulanus]
MSRNKLLVPGSEDVLEAMKNEIANEFGIELGADQTARNNGKVGGEMVKRLIRMGEQELLKRNSQ